MQVIVEEGLHPNGMDLVVSDESLYLDDQPIGARAKRYTRCTFVANESGDRIVVRAFVADDGDVLDRDGSRPTVMVIKRRLNLMTMRLE